MRSILYAATAACGLLALGCAGGPTAPAENPSPIPVSTTQAALGDARADGSRVEMPLGLYTITLNTSGLSATVEPKEVRTLGAAGETTYELCVDNFFPSPPLRITTVTIAGTNFGMGYEVSHPFAAPSNLDAPASASNRADLGISGRCVVLVDSSSGLDSSTFFTDSTGAGGVTLVPGFMSNAHGFCSPDTLLNLPGFACNTFPYRNLVDETDPECRTSTKTGAAISSSSVTGNYSAAAGGWQRSTMGANNDGWTGYSVLHQGQTARGTLMFDTASLEAVTTVTGDFSLDVAILATYNDPRGGTTPTEKKRNRLPSSDGNPDSFFYDMPRGTCPVTLCNAPTQNWTEGAATSSFSCTVGDWTGSITDGSHGTVSVCIPGVLGDSSVSVDIQSPVSGTGTPGDPYVFSGDLATTGATAGTYQGCFQYRLHESATTPVALDCDLAPVSKEEPKGNYSGHFVVIVSL